MVSPQAAAKRRGADFEISLLGWFRDVAELPAERLRLSGKDDEGDLAVQDVGLTYVVEAKNVKTINLTDFVRQASTEASNYAAARGLDVARVMPLAVVKQRNKPLDQAFVVTTLREFFRRD